MEKLKTQRIRGTTKQNYYSVWRTFNKFFIQLDVKPEQWEDRLTLFIGYLIEVKKVQSQTVKSYISAIKNVLMDDGIEIATDTFMLSALTRACKLNNDTVRTRLPIRKKLLHKLIHHTISFYNNNNQSYLAILYKALFMAAYYGLLRISEVTETVGQHAVQVSDVKMGVNKRKILFILRSSKTHGKYTKPQMVKITTSDFDRKSYNPELCPYQALQDYIDIRPRYMNPTEQFFVFRDYTPVTGLHMRATLHLILKTMGYNETLFNCHSFRMGRSCDLLKYGVPVEVIKRLGRWSSNAVYRYLKHICTDIR